MYCFNLREFIILEIYRKEKKKLMAAEYRYECCETGFFTRVVVVTLLVLFAGLMSGLTLGLMSMSLVDLEVLANSGTPSDRKHACKYNILSYG